MPFFADLAYNASEINHRYLPAPTSLAIRCPAANTAMGIYDRDYQRGGSYQDHQPGFHLGAPTTLTTKLVIVTFVAYVAQLLTQPWLTQFGILPGNWWRWPWHGYRLLTYGFLHDPEDLKHIAFNMPALWIFGRDVEARYGSREFLLFYLVSIVVAGLAWTLAEVPTGGAAAMLGASGGVSAVVILFAMNFPHRTVLLMFVIPMPMWVLAVFIVMMDAFGTVSRAGTVAFTAHLGGAAFGFLYYKSRMRLERWLPTRDWLTRLKPKPKLRVHAPDEHDDTDSEVDEILKKIQEQGQDSLTRRERRILEEASREYQRRRH